MRYGVVLPIWQLALSDAERLARNAPVEFRWARASSCCPTGTRW
jgi:hypothetical protein